MGPLLMCEDEVRRVPPGIPGVYLLHAFDDGWGYYRPIYAGKADALDRRLAQHLVSRATAPEVAFVRVRVQLYFSAAPVLDPFALDRVEAGLVLLLRPPFNRQVPTAQPVYCNLPPMVLERRTH